MKDIALLKHYPLQKIIFFLFLFFLPQQFGPHFWPIFSFVRGIRIDYLSPTVYISDILVLLLFITSFKHVFLSKQTQTLLSSKLFVLFIIILLIPLLYSFSPANIFYSFFLFFKFLYVGLFSAVIIKKQDLIPISFVFLLTGVLESILATFQFFHQESIGGILYFLGERTIFLSSIGAAVVQTDSGLLLRPYGTFPHPNVLAFFLLTSFIFGFYFFKNATGNTKRYLSLGALTIIQLGILFSFSRTIILLNIAILAGIGLLTRNVKNFRNQMITVILFLLPIGGFLVFFSNRVSNPGSIMGAIIPRVDLFIINFEILKTNLLFGVGLNNYFLHQVEFQKNFSSIYLQPVHNIYMLTAVQIGIIGLGIILYFLYKTARRLWRLIRSNKNIFSFHLALFTLLLALLFVGLFDHYPLTINQGQLLTACILGLSWSKNLFKD